MQLKQVLGFCIAARFFGGGWVQCDNAIGGM